MAAGRAQPGVKGRTRGLHVAHGQSVCGALSVTGALTRGQREVTGELGHLGAAQPLCPRWGGSGGTSGILRDTPRPRLACPRGAGRQGRKGRAAEPRGGPLRHRPPEGAAPAGPPSCRPPVRTCLLPSLETGHLSLSCSGATGRSGTAAFLWPPRACFSAALQGGRRAAPLRTRHTARPVSRGARPVAATASAFHAD